MSSNWSGGYPTDEPYTSSYHGSQDPGLLQLVFQLQGIAWTVPQEGAVFVDVGCGRGYTTCAIAAANPSWTVIGLDYMPAHVSEARSLAAEAGLRNVSFHEVDLAQVGPAEAARLVPEADIITLHGLWSWVSDAVQEGILAVLDRLKPGGAAMVSYNTLPGWSNGLAMQRLVHLMASQGTGKPTDRVTAAMDVVKRLHDADAIAFKNSHLVKMQVDLVEHLLTRTYVAHEMLSDHWRAYFAHEVWRRMARVKLDYVGSVNIPDNFLPFQLLPAQRAIVDSLPAGPTRELATDIITNRQFRRDVFVRGARQLVPLGAWRDLRLVRCSGGGVEAHKFKVPVGEGEIPAETMRAGLDALAEGPRTIGQMLEVPEVSRMSPWEMIVTFVGSGHAGMMWRDDPGPDSEAAAIARRFAVAAARRYVADDTARGSMALAVPCLGAGLGCSSPQLVVAGTLIALQQEAPDAPLPDEVTLARRLLRPDATSATITEAEADMRKMLVNLVPVWRRFGLLR